MENSLFVVERSDVRQAADNAVAFAKKTRDEAFEAAIAKAMAPRRVWFRLQSRTREEAEAYVSEMEDSGFGFVLPTAHTFRPPNDWAEAWALDMQEALRASRSATVYLDASDARLVARFLAK